jgi:arylsulfatase A-like enzyme
MLTGRSTLGHGVTTNDGDLFDPSDTIALDLRASGYHTLLVGKYLTSYSGTRQPPGWDRVAMSGAKQRSIFSVDGVALSYAPKHHDQAVRRVARDWLRSAPTDRPVFAMVAPRAPHRQPGACKQCRFLPTVRKQDRKAPECQGIPPFRPPSYSLTQVGPAGAWKMPSWPNGWPMRRLCESLVVVDRMVGQLVKAQAARGRTAWFVFLSDNGMAWGQKGFPLKRVPGSTRVPFYLAGPGVPASAASQALVTNLDIFPTLRDIAGLSSSGRAGRSLLPIASDPRRDGHDEVLELMPAGGPAAFVDWAAIRTPDWHFIRWFSGLRELYDMRSDPWELDDLMDERPGVAAELEARLDALIAASD